MNEKLFESFYARLAKEGFLKALFWGLIVGFSAMLISSFIFWFIGFSYPWIAFIIAAVAAAGATPIFYFAIFRPTSHDVACRIDALGLEERFLTMHQLEGDNSYIAMRQREDAKAALKSVSANLIKIAVSVPLVIAVAFTALAGSGMATVSVLAASGYIPPASDIIPDPFEPEPVFYEVEFVEEGEGMIEGDVFQLVQEGKNIKEVIAVPDEGWFLHEWHWEIAGETFSLTDTEVFFIEDMSVDGPLTIYATFAEAEAGSDSQEGDGEGAEGEEGEEESDEQKPQDPQESDQEQEDGKESQSPPPESEDGNEKPPEGSNRYDDKNQIINNETYYGDEYDDAKQGAVDEMEQSEEISDEIKDIVKDYFDNIEK